MENELRNPPLSRIPDMINGFGATQGMVRNTRDGDKVINNLKDAGSMPFVLSQRVCLFGGILGMMEKKKKVMGPKYFLSRPTEMRKNKAEKLNFLN